MESVTESDIALRYQSIIIYYDISQLLEWLWTHFFPFISVTFCVILVYFTFYFSSIRLHSYRIFLNVVLMVVKYIKRKFFQVLEYS